MLIGRICIIVLFCSLCCMHKYEMVIICLMMVLTYLPQKLVDSKCCLLKDLVYQMSFRCLLHLFFNLALFTSCKTYLHVAFMKLYRGLFHAYVFLGASHIVSGRIHLHFLRIVLLTHPATRQHFTPNYGPGS